MRILMGTKNPGKIQGAKEAFEKYFEDVEVIGVDVNSEINAQPINAEVVDGAKNRIKNVKKYAVENNITADFYIASEAGINNLLGTWIDINVAVIENFEGLQSVGISQGFEIPEKYMDEIRKTELGSLMARLFNEQGINKRGGGINVLTKEVITRIDLTRNAFIMALVRQINGDLWR